MPADLPPSLRRRVPLWAGAVLACGAIGAGAVVLPLLRLDPVPLVQTAPELAAPAPGAEPQAQARDAAPDPRVPRFDLVRTDADGQTLVAGRAAPHVQVDLVVDGVTRAETRSDGAGQFVAFLALDRSDTARVLWLVARDARGDRIASDDTVILAPDAGPPPPQAGTGLAGLSVPPRLSQGEGAPAGPAAAASPGDPPAVMPGVEAPDGAAPLPGGTPAVVGRSDAARDPVAAPGGVTEAVVRSGGGSGVPEGVPGTSPPDGGGESGPVARARIVTQPLLSDAEGVRVMAPAPLAGEALRVDSIAYGAEGAVVLRGRVAPGGPGAPGGVVRATLSGLPPVEVAPDPDGTWTLRLLDVAPGDYRLDVARAAEAGGPGTDTVTLPFRRAPPEDVDAALEGVAARVVTVQPGATLWAIARDRYGDGARYVQVYDANRGAIGDPDLIYPGQVFRLPDPERP